MDDGCDPFNGQLVLFQEVDPVGFTRAEAGDKALVKFR